jgi:prepilin-type N-terminal cleavage/methylation domain-containing protein
LCGIHLPRKLVDTDVRVGVQGCAQLGQYLLRGRRKAVQFAQQQGGSSHGSNGADIGAIHMTHMQRSDGRSRAGFSLVEMLVAVALFTVVMLISTSTLLALVDANRKAQALQSVMNNLNTAIDGMVRSIRMGTSFHCGNAGAYAEPRDCTTGDTLFAFEPFGGSPNLTDDQWLYWYDGESKRLYKSVNAGVSRFPLTAPEVRIDEVKFYVVGSASGEQVQPKVVITMRGTAGVEKVKTQTTFNIQATAVQRVIDI